MRNVKHDKRWFVGSIPNPTYPLANDNGLSPAVQNWIINQREAQCLVSEIRAYAVAHPDATLWIECIGGRHRSVAVAELVASDLRSVMSNVEVIHLELKEKVS